MVGEKGIVVAVAVSVGVDVFVPVAGSSVIVRVGGDVREAVPPPGEFDVALDIPGVVGSVSDFSERFSKT